MTMELIQWTEEMSVGSPVLDGHHQMLIDCLNRLQPLLDGDGNDQRIGAVMASLEDFVLVHFSEEEQEMKLAGYPDWRQHKDLHDRMYDLVFSMKSDIERGKMPDARHLYGILHDWLISHILGEDRKYVPYTSKHDHAPVGTWKRSNGREY